MPRYVVLDLYFDKETCIHYICSQAHAVLNPRNAHTQDVD